MGKSAKLHKRVPKKSKSTASSGSGPSNNPAGSSAQAQVQAAKKRSKLKNQTSGKPRAEGEKVLGGADYVSLMMGGRRKAQEEALKLPQDD